MVSLFSIPFTVPLKTLAWCCRILPDNTRLKMKKPRGYRAYKGFVARCRQLLPDVKSLPLDCSGWFTRNIKHNPINATHFIDDAVGDFTQ